MGSDTEAEVAGGGAAHDAGRAHYLQAVECAEAGRHEAALGHFEHALAAAPGLHEARFQWGLLLLTLGRAQAAVAVLEVFDRAPLHPALDAFQRGLRCIAAGEPEGAVRQIRAGLSLKHPNAPLRQDMVALCRWVEASLGQVGESLPEGAQQEPLQELLQDPLEVAVPPHYLLQAYEGSSSP